MGIWHEAGAWDMGHGTVGCRELRRPGVMPVHQPTYPPTCHPLCPLPSTLPAHHISCMPAYLTVSSGEMPITLTLNLTLALPA
jgi:hypothetical protein